MARIPNLAHAAIAAMMLHVTVPGMAKDNARTAEPPPPPVFIESRPAPRPPAPATTPPVRGPRVASLYDVAEFAARIRETHPVRAKREGREGVVGVTVTVTPDGRVDACTVTQSSGHADLDQAACAGIRRFGRFKPALDRQGKPTPGEFSTRITYRLP